MKTQTPRNSGAKQRIISASLSLFSRKGFDATSVNEIAEEAKITKALIYYYFKSKEEILDDLIQSMLGDWNVIARDFISKSIVDMIENGRLEVKPDGPRFVDREAKSNLLENSLTFFRQMLDFNLTNRLILRIMMLESLKTGKHSKRLTSLMDLRARTADNLLFKAIAEADKRYVVSKDIVLFEFFFFIIPFICFATYYDDCKEISGLSEKEMEETFLHSVRVILDSMLSGGDILYVERKLKPTEPGG